jgi:hypothetical protein
MTVPVVLRCVWPDRFVAVSYDVKQKKPELSIAWAGDSLTEKVRVVGTTSFAWHQP